MYSSPKVCDRNLEIADTLLHQEKSRIRHYMTFDIEGIKKTTGNIMYSSKKVHLRN